MQQPIWIILAIAAPLSACCHAQPASQIGQQAAVFSPEFQAAHRGAVRVSVPEVYELVNVAIALTPTAEGDDMLVAKHTPYYQRVRAYFSDATDHPFVKALDAELQKDKFRYTPRKMNAYSFEFDDQGKIVRSNVYRRTGHTEDTSNALLPYLALMQDFSDESGFRAFYRREAPFYQSQVREFEERIDARRMLAWLTRNFPAVKPYDYLNIVFSPLVLGYQSVTHIESNGFSELQAHVNFPYPRPGDKGFSPQAVALRHAANLFTELNHGFIDPTTDLYEERINRALADRSAWVKEGEGTVSYSTPELVFNEMLNWGLLSLYIVDNAPAEDAQKLIAALNEMMGPAGRGFSRFPEFNLFLVDAYRRLPEGATVASLYPAILDWFEAQQNPPSP